MIGVLGGTFDPPHLGHLTLADLSRAAMGLDQVLWVVTTHSPLKQAEIIAPVEYRIQMVQAAIKDDPFFVLSRADIDRSAPYYALGTLQWLADRHQGARFAYLMGADTLNDLPLWHKPIDFVKACAALGVMHRSGVNVDMERLERDLPGISQKIQYIDAPMVEISAQDIRRRVKAGESFRNFVPPGVAEIIIQNRLYK
jgi:nicotinate-nucleotide adenylyltransferase